MLFGIRISLFFKFFFKRNRSYFEEWNIKNTTTKFSYILTISYHIICLRSTYLGIGTF